MRPLKYTIAILSLLGTSGLGAQTAPRAAIETVDRLPAGATTVTLDADDIRASSARSLPELLAGRVAGLSVTFASGLAGVAPRIQVRGSTGAQGAPEPLLFVDGILMREDPMLFGSPVVAVAGTLLPAFMWEIPVEQIERVVVVLGAASGALLEFGAPRGAILVTTRRPADGANRVDAFVEAMSPSVPSLPDNFGTRSVEYGTESRYCTSSNQVLGNCTATTREQWNPVEGVGLPSAQAGLRAGVQGTGGFLGGAWRSGATFERLQTMAPRDGLDRLSLAASYARQVGERLDVSADARYRRADGYYGPLATYLIHGLIGRAATDSFGGFWVDPERIRHSAFAHDVEQVVVSSQVAWAVNERLRASARIGVDRGQRRSKRRAPAMGPYWATSEAKAARDDGASLSGDVSFSHPVRADVVGRATASATMLRGWSKGIDESFTALPTNSGTVSTFSGTDRRLTLALNDRLDFGGGRSLGIGARHERHGKGEFALESGVLPSIDASWVIPDASVIGASGMIGALRLRAAHGAGVELPTFDFVTSVPFFGLGIGAEGLKLPHTAETEVGVSAELFRKAATVELTAFQRDVRDALYLLPAPVSSGSAFYIRQGARWRIRGVDLNIALAPIRRGDLEWRTEFTTSFLKQANPEFNFSDHYLSLYGSAPRYYMSPNTPLGTMMARPYLFADLNADGVVDSTEVVRDSVPVSVGNGQPKRIYSVNTSVAFGGRVTIGAELDGKGGHVAFNGTEYDRCRASRCRALHDPSRPLAEQARAVAALYKYTEFGFYEDASFVKLRELWLRVGLTRGSPADGGRTVELMISGRNLVTWTGYSGLDPEVGSWLGGGLSAGSEMSYPLLRSVSVQLRMAW